MSPEGAGAGAGGGAPGAGLARWLWRSYLAPQRAPLGAALLLMVVEGVSVGLFARAMEPMFDDVFVGREAGAVRRVGAVLLAIFAVRAAASALQKVLLAQAAERSALALRADLLGHLMALDGAWHARHPPGHLIERVHGDVGAIGAAWTTLATGAARDGVSVLSLLAVAAMADWRWTLAALLGLPLLVGPAHLLQRLVRRRAHAAREFAAAMSMRLDEAFHGLAAVKLYALEAYQAARYRALLARRARAEVKGAAARAAIPAVVDVLTGLGFLLVLLLGGPQIVSGERTAGEFMAFFTAMALAVEPLRRLAGLSGLWSQAAASAERLRAVLGERPALGAPAWPRPPPPREPPPAVELSGVHLAYGGAPALRGLSLRADGGRTTALVGASGAGKSSVFHLLTRLVDPDRGTVEVGGVPVGAMDPAALRALFSVVSQDALLFDDSLRENILLGRTDVGEERLRAVLDAARVDFLPALPQGLDSPAGPRGSFLSGGQRARVAIARALLRDAPVLLLDEATAALDARSEAAVQEALARLSAGRTTLVIAHRLATVRAADRIVVMDRGRAVEEGTHDALLAAGGAYAALHRLQGAEAPRRAAGGGRDGAWDEG